MDLILQTKLQPPQLKGKILRRERLIKRLKDNLEKKLILVCADAGYGKTTLLTTFIKQVKKPYAWLTLNSGDRCFNTFIKYMIAGIRQYFPEFGNAFLWKLIKNGFSVNMEETLISFANSLQAVSHVDIWTILDDYHNVSDSHEITECMNFLLTNSPSNLHFIIASRAKPLFSVSRLKSKGEYYELSADDMKFTYEETQMLFRDIWRSDHEKEKILRLWTETNGWITAIYLYLSSLRENRELELTIRSSEMHAELYKYLAEEILTNQEKTIRNFLIKTSIFDVLQPKICDRLLQTKRSQKILHQLADSGLFTHCIDSEQELYQYHPLFREFLLNTLEKGRSANDLQGLYAKAGRIMEESGDLYGALAFFIRIKKWHSAANLLHRMLKENIQRLEVLQIEQYLEKFPLDYIEKDARLLFLKGLIAYYKEKYQNALGLMKQAQSLLEKKGRKRDLLKVLTAEANLCMRSGRYEDALFYAAQALGLNPGLKEKAEILCFAKGPSELCLGKIKDAEASLALAYDIYDRTRYSKGRAVAMVHLSALSYEIGDLIKAGQYCETARQLFEELNDNFHLGIALINLATIHNILREDEKAKAVIDQALDIGRKFDIKEVYGEAVCQLAELKINKGDEAGYGFFEESLKAFQEIEDICNVTASMLSYGDAKRRRGHLTDALRLINKAGENINAFKLGKLTPLYKIVRGIAECESGYYSRAEADLSEARELSTPIGNRYYVFLCDLYLAYLHHLTGNERSSRAIFEQCLSSVRKDHYEPILVTEHGVSVPLLISRLALRPDDNFSISVLEKVGARATKYLLPLLDEKNVDLSRAVIELLARIDDPACIDKLRRYTAHPELGDTAAFALKCISTGGVKDLVVNFLGKMAVYRNDELIKTWKYNAVRNLFQFLVINKGRRILRDEIIETLWPGMPLDKALAGLYNALSSLRKILEPGKHGKTSMIRLENECVWLDWRDSYSYDVDRFLENYRLGKIKEKGDPRACLMTFSEAQKIYRGDFLGEEKYVDWIEPERRRLREIYIETLSRTAVLHIQRQEYDKAMDFHKKILELDPCIEESHRALMLCHWKRNDKKKAVEQYKICEEVLTKHLGLSPLSETKRLFEVIVSHQK